MGDMMVYLIILFSSFLFFNLYKKYFEINISIIISYYLIFLLVLLFNLNDNSINTMIFYFIYSFLYLSFIIDIKEQWISDLTVIMIFLINTLRIIIDYIIYNKHNDLSGLIFVFLFIVIIFLIELIIKKELMGFGDLKLYFVLSIGLSVSVVLLLIILSSFIGLLYYFIFYRNKEYFPFGPAIIISYLLIYIIKTGLELI